MSPDDSLLLIANPLPFITVPSSVMIGSPLVVEVFFSAEVLLFLPCFLIIISLLGAAAGDFRSLERSLDRSSTPLPAAATTDWSVDRFLSIRSSPPRSLRMFSTGCCCCCDDYCSARSRLLSCSFNTGRFGLSIYCTVCSVADDLPDLYCPSSAITTDAEGAAAEAAASVSCFSCLLSSFRCLSLSRS